MTGGKIIERTFGRFDPGYRARNWRFLSREERLGRNIPTRIKNLEQRTRGYLGGGGGVAGDLPTAVPFLPDIEPDIVGTDVEVRKTDGTGTTKYVGGQDKQGNPVWSRQGGVSLQEKVLEFEWETGGLGVGDGQFDPPFHVGLSPSGDVFVSDGDGQRVQKFNPSTGAFVSKFGTFGSGNGQFGGPRAIDFDAAGNIYVADRNNNRVSKWTPAGAWTSNIIASTPLPWGLCLDAAGNIYVSQETTDGTFAYFTVRKFNSAGVHQWTAFTHDNVGIRGLATDGTLVWVPCYASGKIVRLRCSDGGVENPPIELPGLPTDVAYVASSGTLYVSRESQDSLLEFTKEGQLIRSWGTEGTGQDNIKDPSSIAVSPDESSLYVADNLLIKVKKWSQTIVETSVDSLLLNEGHFTLASLPSGAGGLSLKVPPVPTGTILMYAGELAPQGFLLCQGQAIIRAQNQDLFDLIGTTYGVGDGSTTFNLPDLRSRVPFGLGTHADNDTLGETGGARTVTLTADQSGLRAHDHSIASGQSGVRRQNEAGANNTAGQGGGTTGTTGPADAAASHTNMPPFLTINFIIKT